MNRIWIALVLLALVAGCAGSPPAERSHYLLRAEAPRNLAPADPEAQIGFDPVRLAPYLERAGVIIELSDQQIREAAYHLWAEPLDQAIGLYLRDQVAIKLGHELAAGPGSKPDTWRYRVIVGIERLHGSLEGEVQLVARFTIRDQVEGTGFASVRVIETIQQAQPGYPALVRSEIDLLDILAGSIADALEQAPSGASAAR